MTKFLQAVPAALAACVLVALVVGLFVPRERWPEPFRERIPLAQVKRAEATTPAVVEPQPPAIAIDPTQPAVQTPLPAFPPVTPRKPIVAMPAHPSTIQFPPAKSRPETVAELMNCRFTEPPNSFDGPRAVEVAIPEFPGRNAVWGATGCDAAGRIWIGVSVDGPGSPSARLFCYDSQTGELADCGDVTSALLKHGLLRSGETQFKIHSKIILAGDGHLYFASMDEHGEASDGSVNPTWGGHLWRLRLPERTWEHLHSAPEALIAVAGMGRYIYALGYYGHVLVQFDTESGAIRTVTVGSVDGHVSRSFLADLNGHVFVPRLAHNEEKVTASLVEFDAALQEIHSTPLEFYLNKNPTQSHGITGIQPLADGSLAFVTSRGRLYQIVPASNGPAEVRDLGWMHPQGETSISTLFTYDGKSSVLAVAVLPRQTPDWVSFKLGSKSSTTTPLRAPAKFVGVDQGLLLYGSMTRDAEGAFYVAGTSMRTKPAEPFVWKVLPPK